MSDHEHDPAANAALAGIMEMHGEMIANRSPELAQAAHAALASTPVEARRPPLNWLEQKCQSLFRFLNDCWIGTGSSTQDGSASYDYFLWREQSAEMIGVARSYGRSTDIREALSRLPARSNIEDKLSAMEMQGYVFMPSDVPQLRLLLAEDRIVCRIISDENKS